MRSLLDVVKAELLQYLSAAQIDAVFISAQRRYEYKCSWRILRGKHINELCNRRTFGDHYCKKHSEKPTIAIPNEDQCSYIRKNGKKCKKRKNSELLCKNHLNLESKKQKTNLPTAAEVIDDDDLAEDNNHATEVIDDDDHATEVIDDNDHATEVIDDDDLAEDNDHATEVIDDDDHATEVIDDDDLAEIFDDDDEIKSEKVEDLIPPPLESPPFKDKSFAIHLGKTNPLMAYGSDDDLTIDQSELIEVYDKDQSWGCQKWIEDRNSFCGEETVVNNQFCSKHKKYAGKIPFKIGLHTEALLEVNPVYLKIHEFTGQFWYPRLLLVAKPTSEGLVIIGKLVGHRWLKTLTRKDIKRCQNSGLLYKVISQEILHFNYHIPELNRIDGSGFTDFDQMRIQRPLLYIKYWNIWNQHISRRKQFILSNQKCTNANKWMKEHTCPLPNWDDLKKQYYYRGYRNIVIPPPSLVELKIPDFDAWDYCEQWVRKNAPGEIGAPHFPPMFLDYPDPFAMRFRPYNRFPLKEERVDTKTPRRTKHYKRDPNEWIEILSKKGKQWMQIYF